MAATAVVPANANIAAKPDSGDKTIVPASKIEKLGVPTTIYDALKSVQKEISALNEFNHYEWDESATRLVVHHRGGADKIAKTLSSAVPRRDFALAEDKYSVRELRAEADRIVAAYPTIDGAAVVSAGPTKNADGIVIQTQSGPQRLLETPADSSVESVYPLIVEEGPRAEPIDRQYDPSPPHWGGALMSRPTSPGKSSICTTGFGVGYMSGTTLVTKNLTADHCGPTGAVWRTGNYSDSAILGAFGDTNSGGSDLKLISTLAGRATSFGGVIYDGPTNSNTGLGIKGAVPPILNDYWCYSGSQSGMICNNKVTEINKSVCYGFAGLGPCYSQMAISVQQDGISAAGNGDSGGPVVAARNGYAYAAGIISGILGRGNNCQGVPATETRKCSATVITAPVHAFFNANPNYGILTNG